MAVQRQKKIPKKKFILFKFVDEKKGEKNDNEKY